MSPDEQMDRDYDEALLRRGILPPLPANFCAVMCANDRPAEKISAFAAAPWRQFKSRKEKRKQKLAKKARKRNRRRK